MAIDIKNAQADRLARELSEITGETITTMVIDTSAVMAILNLEPEAKEFADAISADSVRLMSMGTALELSIIVRARKEDAGIRELEFFLQ